VSTATPSCITLVNSILGPDGSVPIRRNPNPNPNPNHHDSLAAMWVQQHRHASHLSTLY